MSWLQQKMARSARGEHRVEFCDITHPEFKPESYGLTMDDFMAEIHVYDYKQDQFMVGMAALRALYEELGMGHWLNWTAWPVIKPGCDFAYMVFARLRPRLGGGSRCSTSQCK